MMAVVGWRGGGEGPQDEGGGGAEVGEYHLWCLGCEEDETAWQPWVRTETPFPSASFPAGRCPLCSASQTQVSENDGHQTQV